MAYRKMTRPHENSDLDQVGDYHRELAAALEELGVEHNEEFVIMPAGAASSSGIYDIDEHDSQNLGPFSAESETSRLAALANYPHSGSQRHRILVEIVRSGLTGRTREELSEKLGLSGNSVRPRVKELLEGDWLEVGIGVRKTPMGNDSEVLVATRKARAEAEAKGEDGLWTKTNGDGQTALIG